MDLSSTIRRVGVIDHGTHGHFHYFWRRGSSVHLFTLAVDAVFCLDNWLIKKVSEVIRVLVGPQNNVAAAPAISAIRPSTGDKLLAPEAHTSTSTVTSLGKNFYPIDKHGLLRTNF